MSHKIIIPTKDIDLAVYEHHKNALKVDEEKTPIPTFFGHYWEDGQSIPKIVNPKAVCLDYSVAKEGKLCAYRFEGEEELSSDKLIYV